MFKKLFKLSGIYLVFSLLSSVVGFLVLPIISHYIAVENFGILATYIVLMSGLLPALIGFSLHSVIARSYHTRNDVNSMIFSSYAFSFFITIITIIFLYLFLNKLNLSSTWSFENLSILILISYVAFISTFNLTLIQLEGRAMLWGVISLVSLVVGITSTFILLFNTDLDFWARIYGIGLNNFVSSIVTIYYLKDRIVVDYSSFKNHVKYYIKLGIPLLITAIFAWLLVYQERFFIEYFLNLKLLGIYSMAFTLSSPLMVVSIAMGRAWTAIGYKYLKDEKYNRYIFNSIYMILILFFLGIMNSLFGKYIYIYMIDEKYYPSFEYIPYLTIVFFITGVGKFILPVFLHFERVGFFTYINIISVIISVSFTFFFIEQYKLFAVLYTAIFVQLFILVSTLIYIHKKKFLYE